MNSLRLTATCSFLNGHKFSNNAKQDRHDQNTLIHCRGYAHLSKKKKRKDGCPYFWKIFFFAFTVFFLYTSAYKALHPQSADFKCNGRTLQTLSAVCLCLPYLQTEFPELQEESMIYENTHQGPCNSLRTTCHLHQQQMVLVVYLQETVNE